LAKAIFIKLFVLLLGLFWSAIHLQSQNIYIEIQPTDDIPYNLNIPGHLTAEDSATTISKLKQLKSEILEKGYLTASFDSIQWRTDSVTAFLRFGQLYKWAFLRSGNIPEAYLSASRFREKMYTDKPFSPKAFARVIEGSLKFAENNGFPFATIRLDSLRIVDQNIYAVLNMDRNMLTVIDSIILKGDVKTNRSYLQNYLGIRVGQPYNQSNLDRIPSRLKELPFIKVIKPYEVGMRPGKADIYLYLDPKKASNFNGIIGIMPDINTGKTLITGDVELNLLNSFRQGETLNLKWQRLQSRTQELNSALHYPFLFNTPFGLELGFDLYRRDTLFSNISALIGAQYYFKSGNYARLFYENNQSNVISSEAFSINEFIDSRINLYGVGLNFRDIDYKFNPSKGYFTEASIAAGTKTILKNPNVEASEYDNLQLVSDIYNITLNTGLYIPLATRSVIMMRIRGAYLLNDNMFKNEIFRIGGLKTIRGFNEQSIFASGYGVATIEYRFLLEENSNIFLFFDQGAYEDRSDPNLISDTPFGLGAGINFETNAGVFSLTYALGKQFDNEIEIRNGKIHFGFISFF